MSASSSTQCSSRWGPFRNEAAFRASCRQLLLKVLFSSIELLLLFLSAHNILDGGKDAAGNVHNADHGMGAQEVWGQSRLFLPHRFQFLYGSGMDSCDGINPCVIPHQRLLSRLAISLSPTRSTCRYAFRKLTHTLTQNVKCVHCFTLS